MKSAGTLNAISDASIPDVSKQTRGEDNVYTSDEYVDDGVTFAIEINVTSASHQESETLNITKRNDK